MASLRLLHLLSALLSVHVRTVLSVTVSAADLRLSHRFAATHFGCPVIEDRSTMNSTSLPFSFRVGGQSSAQLLQSWKCTLTTAVYQDRTSNRITFVDPSSQLVVTVNVTTFRESPATEWVLEFHNAGSLRTPTIADVFAADLEFAAGTSTFELTHALAYGEGIPTDYMAQLTRLGCQPGCTCASPTGLQVPNDAECGCINPGNPPGPSMQQPNPTVDHLTLGTNGGRSSSGSTVCPPYDGPIGNQNNGSLPFFRLAIAGTMFV